MTEEVAAFGSSPLVGILNRPDSGTATERPCVVLLTPGMLHRVGPNRTYVKIARALASHGFTVLRFDHAGNGDSPVRTDQLPLIQAAIAEATDAIDQVTARSGSSRVLLMGHCSGALLGLYTAFSDRRVAGVVAINPEGLDDNWTEFDRRRKDARYYTNYYRRTALTDPGRWRRLLTGKADYSSIVSNVFRGIIWGRIWDRIYRIRNASGVYAAEATERPENQEFIAGLRQLEARRLPMLFVHPDQSESREMLRAQLGDTVDRMREAGTIDVAIINDSDHMFTPLAAQSDLVETVCRWALEVGVPTREPEPAGVVP